MTAPASVVVVGSCNIDLVARVPRLPLPGETLTGTAFGTYLGGKGLNQAVAARRMGASVAMVARVGADDFGRRVTQALHDEGIDAAQVTIDEQQPTGTAVILVEESGENNIVVIPGANGALTTADIDRAAEQIRAAHVLLLQLEIPLETTLHAARLAHAAETTVILTPAPAQQLPATLLAATDVLVPNEVEVTQVLGTQARPSEAAQALLAQGCRAVVVTLGAQGALLVTAEGEQAIAPFAVTPVDTVGAGDAFVGALAAGLAAGQELTTALRYASAAGAIATTRPGAMASLPSHDEIEQFLRAQD
ncbi:MAG: ribokinase [Chloroflexi bacterium]|nr:ribokinase [Chloroflexota bacterium]